LHEHVFSASRVVGWVYSPTTSGRWWASTPTLHELATFSGQVLRSIWPSRVNGPKACEYLSMTINCDSQRCVGRALPAGCFALPAIHIGGGPR
jgi:hypothetical protein